MNGGTIDGKQVLTTAVVAKLSRPYADLHSRFRFENGKYGYGLFVHNYRGADVVWHAGLMPGFGALLQMVPAHHFAVIVLANRSGALLNETAEKAMEIMLPLGPKAEAKSEQPLAVSAAELREYVGTYTNKPESADLLIKKGSLVLRWRDVEYSTTKIGDHRFSITNPSDSEAGEFVLVRGRDGKAEYLHIGRHALKKVH